MLETLLREHLPDVDVWAYGSRVNGRAHDGSDLDLVLRGPGLEKIPSGRLAAFEDAMRESNIPFLVEARDWARLPERFHREIEREHVVLVESDPTPKTLGDYFTLQRGTTYKSRLLGQDGPVLLGLASIQRNGGFRTDSLRMYGGECPEKLMVRPGELYVSLKDVTQSADLLGAVAQLPPNHAPGRLTQDTVKLIPKRDDVPVEYIHWLLRTPEYRHYCRAHATGTTNLGLPREDFLAYPVAALTPARSRLVELLDALDDKTELNRRVNDTLEAMARALFKSWFVDFEPVRAKMEGRDTFLPRQISTLFPDRMADSEIGQVPSGWKIESLGQHVSVCRGLSYSGVGLCREHEGRPMHNLNSIFEGGGYKYSGIKHYRGKHHERHVVKQGELLVANTEQGFDRLLIGHAAIVPRCFGLGSLFSHHLYRIDIEESSCLTPSFLLYLMNDPGWHACISGFSNGTTINMLPVDAFNLPLLAVPTVELIRAFTKIAEGIRQSSEIMHAESTTLGRVRDTLLPKLISGEMRVPQAEEAVSAVVGNTDA